MKTLIRPLVIAAGVLWAASAHAGASRIGNAYYEDIFPFKDCPSISGCIATSSAATPSDAYVRMKHFYCNITATSETLYSLQLELWTAPPGMSGASRIKTVPLSFSPPVASNSTTIYYNIDHDILLATGPGRYVVFNANFLQVGSASLSCAITGDLIPPPAQ